MCDLDCKIELVCVSFVTLTTPLYMLVIAMLIRKRHTTKLKGSFYTIAIATGIVDLLTISHHYAFRRTYFRELIPWLHEVGGSPLFIYWAFVTIGGMKAQVILVFATAINRYSATTQPVRYKTIWTPKHANRVILLSLLVAYGSTLSIVACKVWELSPNGANLPHIPCAAWGQPIFNSSHTRYAACFSDKCWMFPVASAGIIIFVITFVLIGLYARMLCVSLQWGQEDSTNSATRNLAIMGALLSALVVGQAAQLALASVRSWDPDWKRIRRIIGNVQMALFSMSNPILILCFARDARTAFGRFVGITKEKKRGKTGQK